MDAGSKQACDAVPKETLPEVGRAKPTYEGLVLDASKQGSGELLAGVKDAMSSALEFAKDKTTDLTTQTEKVSHHTTEAGMLHLRCMQRMFARRSRSRLQFYSLICRKKQLLCSLGNLLQALPLGCTVCSTTDGLSLFWPS